MKRETLEEAEADWRCRNCGTLIQGDACYTVCNVPRRRGCVTQTFPLRYHTECLAALREKRQLGNSINSADPRHEGL